MQYRQLNVLQTNLNNGSCGFEVLGFPSNQFGLQEPGETEYEILNGLKYVRPGHGYVPNFTLFKKRDVNGEAQDEVYTFLKSYCRSPDGFIDDLKAITWSPVRNDDINWNFEKFLINHEGQPYRRYTAPTDPEEIVPDINHLLNECNKSFGQDKTDSRELQYWS